MGTRVNYVVVWDTDCGDPHKEFNTEKQALEFVTELFADEEEEGVDRNSIRLYKVSSVKRPVVQLIAME